MNIAQAEAVAVHYNFLTVAEVQALKFWTSALPPDPVVINIGAGAGSSGLAFLEARDDLKLISVDIQNKDGHVGLGLERLTLQKAGIESERYEQITGNSADVGGAWERGAVDLVFIDGDHSYDQVCRDIRAWTPHLKEGGILCGHDYGFDKYPGVKQAFDELGWKQVGLIDHLVLYRRENYAGH